LGLDTALTFLQRNPAAAFLGRVCYIAGSPLATDCACSLVEWMCPLPAEGVVGPALLVACPSAHSQCQRLSPSVDAATAGALPGSRQLWPGSLVVQDGLPRHLGLPVFFVRDRVVAS